MCLTFEQLEDMASTNKQQRRGPHTTPRPEKTVGVAQRLVSRCRNALTTPPGFAGEVGLRDSAGVFPVAVVAFAKAPAAAATAAICSRETIGAAAAAAAAAASQPASQPASQQQQQQQQQQLRPGHCFDTGLVASG